jgi:hypothetical protein
MLEEIGVYNYLRPFWFLYYIYTFKFRVEIRAVHEMHMLIEAGFSA